MNPDHSVVAVCDTRYPEGAGRSLYRALAGTGALLTPTLVLTAAHIFEGAENEPLSETVRKSYVAGFETLEYRPVRVALSKVLDICCLEFPIIECAIPCQWLGQPTWWGPSC